MSTIRTTCTRDCPDMCAVVAHVENGRVVKLAGDTAHPLTRGFLCKKTYQYPSRVYSSQRILHPLKRTKGGWRRITWDDAFDMLAEWLTTVQAQEGSLAVLSYQSAGSMGLLKALNQRFFNLWGGVTEAVGSLCSGAGIAGQLKSYGAVRSHAPEDLLNSRTILIWGRNPLVTNIHMLPLLKAAKARGATVVVIDPRRSETVKYADQHVALKPGGDRYLAIGLAQSLLRQGLVDWEFLTSATANFAEFARLQEGIDHQIVLDQTGLSAEVIDALAHLYGTQKPGSIHLGMGPQRWMTGAEVFQLIDALAALTGNIGVPGGGVNYASRPCSTCRGWPIATPRPDAGCYARALAVTCWRRMIRPSVWPGSAAPIPLRRPSTPIWCDRRWRRSSTWWSAISIAQILPTMPICFCRPPRSWRKKTW
jgi:anaerobic selenocysteine-containing dehydrogenase